MDKTLERLQAYLASPTEPEAKALTALAAQREKELVKDILSSIERLKAEGMEKALFYNPITEQERAYRTKEITEEEYKNNPLKRAYDEYAAAIPYKIADLSEPCLVRAIAAAPEYTRAVDKAIKRAESLIKYIQKETGSSAETMAFIVNGLIADVCLRGYALFHPQEEAERNALIESGYAEIEKLYEQVKEPPADKVNDALYRQIRELEALQMKQFQHTGEYKVEQAQGITERILGRIFPGEKPAIRRAISKAERPETLEGYTYNPNNAIHQFVKQTLNNPQNVLSMRNGMIATQRSLLTQDISITYSGNDGTIATIELARTKELFKERVRGGAKMYNFFLQKNNEQNGRETTTFLLQELIDSGLYATKGSAYKAIRLITDKMMSMSIEGTQTVYDGRKKKQVRNAKAVIVAQRNISYNSCSISLPPLIRNNAKFITILPVWAYSLSENGFVLLDYIYYLARQNANKIKDRHQFTVSLEAIRVHLGLLTPDKAGANPGRLIIGPIEAAIEDIEGKSKGEIMITPQYSGEDYTNVHEFLAGYLRIELEQRAENYMVEIAKRQEKQLQAAAKREERAALKAQERLEQESINQLKLTPR